MKDDHKSGKKIHTDMKYNMKTAKNTKTASARSAGHYIIIRIIIKRNHTKCNNTNKT